MRNYLGRRSGDQTIVHVQESSHENTELLANSYGDGQIPFDWGFEGEGAAVLAYSLLVDAVGLLSIDVFYEQFMSDVVAHFPSDSWELNQNEILDYARKKYIEDSAPDMSQSAETRAEDLLGKSISFVKEMQALAFQADLSKDQSEDRMLCDSDDEKAFSPWYHIHPKADKTKDQILMWLKDCEQNIQKP